MRTNYIQTKTKKGARTSRAVQSESNTCIGGTEWYKTVVNKLYDYMLCKHTGDQYAVAIHTTYTLLAWQYSLDTSFIATGSNTLFLCNAMINSY